MKVTLYMAISADGFIAKKDDDTDWVSDTDWKFFSKMVKDSGCIVMGRRTYEVSSEDFPYDCDLNIVLTSNKKLHSKSNGKALFTNKTPKELMKFVKNKGFNKLLVIGGGKLNTSFLKAGLIDEIYLSVHPLILGEGIKLFEGGEVFKKLKLVGVKKLKEGLVQLHYKL